MFANQMVAPRKNVERVCNRRRMARAPLNLGAPPPHCQTAFEFGQTASRNGQTVCRNGRTAATLPDRR